MSVEYDVFISAFLNKVTEYSYLEMPESDFDNCVNTFMFAACAQFEQVFYYVTGLSFMDKDDCKRCFNWDFQDAIPDATDRNRSRYRQYVNVHEVADIVSEGMVAQWLKPYVYTADNLGNLLNTKDYSVYSPSKLLDSISGVYKNVEAKFASAINEFSYKHGNILSLHM